MFVHTVESGIKKILSHTDIATVKKDLTPHALRHTHTSLLAEAGVDLIRIMERLGHVDDATIRKTGQKASGPYFRLPFGLCSSPCAQTTLQLLACRGRTASLLRQARICGVSLARINKARSRWRLALRFDSWSRHGSMGLKMGQNLILSFPVRKTSTFSLNTYPVL
ncbi:tyrosine-type recombinase/integrase [Sporolactobacillus terrae]|uniref:tyrosine-type recombinase/integrase n=1 Tax=Sporolactobacillus terrae TaxID=269673 RepID=UPI0009DE8423|nr:tyrosine-type recombinase/integrase [Sporolactobacillus terrae]